MGQHRVFWVPYGGDLMILVDGTGVRIFYLCVDVQGGVLSGVPATKAEYLFLILWSHPRCQGVQCVIGVVSLVGAVLMVVYLILLGDGELVWCASAEGLDHFLGACGRAVCRGCVV